MTIFHGIILGLVQGLTEFLPVSSSGHLVVVREIFHIESAGALAVDAVLQLATTLALLVYFWQDLGKYLRDRTLVKAVIVGTIPAVILGLLLETWMETTFRNAHLVALMLVVGGLLMWYAEKMASQDKDLSTGRGFKIGFFQSLALVPGISRSGATISGGLINGLTREDATRFSFLLAIPILLGTGLKKFLDLYESNSLSSIGMPLVIGSIVAFSVGLWAIKFLIKYLKTHKLTPFIYYRIALALIILLLV